MLADPLALTTTTPRFEGAQCRRQPRIFDFDATPKQRAHAIALCERCPMLALCSDHLASTPVDRRPSGVVAGKLIQPGPIRSVGPRARSARDEHSISTADGATAWLAGYLRNNSGAPAGDVIAAAAAAGIRRATLYTARARLGVQAQRVDHCHFTWTLNPYRKELP